MTEISPALLARLHATRGFVFDMDGTLLLGDQRNHDLRPLPGALELTRWLSEHDLPFVVFTNGTARTPQHYAQTLRSQGFTLRDEQMLTPSSSAADYFARQGMQRIMVLGGEGVAGPIRDAGLEVVSPVRGAAADAIYVGWYRELTMDTLEAACYAAIDGIPAYSASSVLFFATAQGPTLGSSRIISAALKDVSGREVEVVGKPSLHALETAAHRLEVPAGDLTVVGDDPELEMALAHRGGALGVAVTTGLRTHEQFAALTGEQRPDLILPGVNRLLELLKGTVPA